jgi:hypothetical protein
LNRLRLRGGNIGSAAETLSAKSTSESKTRVKSRAAPRYQRPRIALAAVKPSEVKTRFEQRDSGRRSRLWSPYSTRATSDSLLARPICSLVRAPVTGALINPATRSSFPDFVAWAELGLQRLGRTRWVNISQMSYDKFLAEVIKRAKFSSKIHESPTSGHNDVEVGYGRIPQQLLRSSDACAIGDGIRRGMADAQVDRH